MEDGGIVESGNFNELMSKKASSRTCMKAKGNQSVNTLITFDIKVPQKLKKT